MGRNSQALHPHVQQHDGASWLRREIEAYAMPASFFRAPPQLSCHSKGFLGVEAWRSGCIMHVSRGIFSGSRGPKP